LQSVYFKLRRGVFLSTSDFFLRQLNRIEDFSVGGNSPLFSRTFPKKFSLRTERAEQKVDSAFANRVQRRKVLTEKYVINSCE